MLKFKNKFKFGSSHGGDKPQASDDYDSSRNSTESGRTISMNHVSEDLSGLSLKEMEAQSADGASGRSIQSKAKSPDTGDSAVPTSMGIANSNKAASSPASSSSPSISSSSSVTSNPGLLTVKMYGSSKVLLPIKINNNKQILHALASNSNNESVSFQLMKDLNNIEDTEFLSGSSAAKLLPSIISIPNGENLVKSLLYLTVEFDNNVLVIEPQSGTVEHSTWNQVVSFDVTKKSANNSTDSIFLNLNLFIRLPNVLIPESEKSEHKHLFTNNQVTSGNNIGDLLIGTIKLPLNLRCHSLPIRLMNHQYLKFSKHDTVEESSKKDTGDIMLTIDFKPVFKTHLSIDDFNLLKVIGKGSFGKVMQVVKKDTKQIYALKTIRKQHIVSRMEVTHTLAERTVLARINNPFIVPLKFSFQSPEKLYLVLSFINGGELFWHLQKEGKFSMDRSRFYIAELLTALESLHELNVIYRDLKPENILLDYQGHIALCDFGLCKLNMTNEDKTNTFCGTPEYLAPELLLNQGYTRSVDWWTLGTLLYEMVTGLPPFYDEDVPTMYRKILQNPLKFPPFLDNTDAQDLLIKLLQKDPKNRLSDAAQIKNHKFFKDIDWNKLLNKSYLPPFKPNVESLLDTSNFDQDFTNEKPQDSVADDFLTESVQKQFGGWTYNGDNVFNN
ncbi:uncharacterized protein PRCAT00000737001 [Priceomyces carsonii]|uniref:uncharacterized protein n=1 Tax=Priceomyces carsonii TaxID=28549 RepID=UPI002EDA792F|nr:unnamed protein product [Priceomyces carsonii]